MQELTQKQKKMIEAQSKGYIASEEFVEELLALLEE